MRNKPMVNLRIGPITGYLFSPPGKPEDSRSCVAKGLAAADYGCALGALALKPFDFCNIGVNDRAKIMARAVWVLVLTAMMVIGCGKKAPPVAPRSAPLIQVSDLDGSLNKGTVRLTWHHTPENAHAVGYIVLRAQSSLARPECPGCPLVFQKVDTIAIPRSQRRKKHALEFYQDVVHGFQYTYSVRPYQSSGAQGPDSNLVVIAYAEERSETTDRGMPP